MKLAPGDPAPDFSVETLDGKTLSLSDFRGKYVLLDFWATWCGWCIAEMPNLKTTWDSFGKDPRFVMMGLSLDADRELPKKFVKHRALGWTQVFLGDMSRDSVTPKYGVYGIPAIFLIGPDGRVLATDLRGPGISKSVADALSR